MIKEFDAVLIKVENKNAGYISPPFDIQEVYGSKRVKVKATLDGYEYRGSIVIMDGITMLGITLEVRTIIGKTFGDLIHVTLEKDDIERRVEIPNDLENLLVNSPTARKTLESLSYTNQKEYITWIDSAKRVETRQERLIKTISLLENGKKLRG